MNADGKVDVTVLINAWRVEKKWMTKIIMIKAQKVSAFSDRVSILDWDIFDTKGIFIRDSLTEHYFVFCESAVREEKSRH